jgi:Alkaline phosphatase
MATSRTPLLADESQREEDDGSSQEQEHWFLRLTSRGNMLPFFLALLGTLILILAMTLLTGLDAPKRKNVVLMISDGMGPASLSLARSFEQYTLDSEFSSRQLPLDPFLIGSLRTRAHSHFPPTGADNRLSYH